MAKHRIDPEKNREYLQEAERLALLPLDDQKEVIAVHRELADNPDVPKECRQAAKERAEALARHLRRLSKRQPKKKPK